MTKALRHCDLRYKELCFVESVYSFTLAADIAITGYIATSETTVNI